MVTSYGQFCPVAKAMELLDERWTLLVVRELLAGSRHFNELRRGGVVDRYDDGNRVSYELTPAGKELGPIVEALGRWGVRWIPQLGDEDLDPHLLMWDLQRNVQVSAVPAGRTVLRFSFRDVPGAARDWWLVITPD
ncbi:MAG: helix-turn-helix transcriptional regulator, partial [Sporichthyaceae bacterium]|nr:helix-turn-helix transcriptional regulator [Sporichthyaceae bacterium]